MKVLTIAIFFIGIMSSAESQSFVNGSFENNSSSNCEYNLTDSEFNSKFTGVKAFGGKHTVGGYVGEIDVHTNNCYLNPQNGSWCVGLASDSAWIVDTSLAESSDAISLALTSPLVAGSTYDLSFYVYGNTEFENSFSDIEIGESMTDDSFGTLIHSEFPDMDAWKFVTFSFTASQNSNFITVRNKTNQIGWNQVDNFRFDNGLPVSQPKELTVSIFPNPVSEMMSIDFGEIVNKGRVSILNSLGQIVKQSRFINKDQLTMELSDVPAGMYLVNLVGDDKLMVTKIIKQ